MDMGLFLILDVLTWMFAAPVTADTLGSSGQVKVDLVIILDSSLSVGYGNYNKMKHFCRKVFLNADVDSGNVRVGMLSYSSRVHIEFFLNQYSSSTDIMSAIDNIPYIEGRTNTAGALRTMRTEFFNPANGDRPDVPNVCIILTDGESDYKAGTILEAEQAHVKNIHVYAVGIGSADYHEVDAIASQPVSENSFHLQSFDELDGLSDTVFQSVSLVAKKQIEENGISTHNNEKSSTERLFTSMRYGTTESALDDGTSDYNHGSSSTEQPRIENMTHATTESALYDGTSDYNHGRSSTGQQRIENMTHDSSEALYQNIEKAKHYLMPSCELPDEKLQVWIGINVPLCVNTKIDRISTKLNLTLYNSSTERLQDIMDEMLASVTLLIDNDEFSDGSLKSLVESLELVVGIIEKSSSGVNTAETDLNLTLYNSSTERLQDIMDEMLASVTLLIDNDEFSDGSLKSLVESLELVVGIIEKSSSGVNTAETDMFVSIIDKILSSSMATTWQVLNNKSKTGNDAVVIMDVVTRFGQRLLANQSNTSITFVRENIVLESKETNEEDVFFPDTTSIEDNDVIFSNITFKASVFLSKDTIKNKLAGSIVYTAVYYSTLAKLLPSRYSRNVGSDIVSFSVQKNLKATDLYPPVMVGFHLINQSDTTCVFWEFDKINGGRWSTEGCFAAFRNSTHTLCHCNHLTNFAVLVGMSTFTETDKQILTILTWPGCVISIICLLITIIVYIYFWRQVGDDKARILVCLCVVLLLAYILLLGGMDKTDSPDACTAIAVILHFLFLCALFLMVAEGIEVALSILPQKQSHTRWLMCFGFVPPVVIVVISVSVTQLNGYGTDEYCWLSASNGLIFAFLVPCGVAVLTNITIAVLIIRTMLSTKFMMRQETKIKIRATARSLAVLAPILSLTWFFGMLAWSNHLVAFSYMFTVLNSLQGLLIFVFHCLLNVKIQPAAKRQWERFVHMLPWTKVQTTDKLEFTTSSDVRGGTTDTSTV